MSDIHPSSTAGTGHLKPRRTTYKPGDRVVELRECAQCGFPFRDGIDTEGDSQDSPGIAMVQKTVAVANNLDRLPQALKPSSISGVRSEVTVQITTSGNFIAIPGMDQFGGATGITGQVFQVRDSQGNIYNCKTGTTLSFAATYDVAFIASEYGPINPDIGTITTIVTPKAGVDSVSNSAVASIVGSKTVLPASLSDFYGSSVVVSEPVVQSGCRQCGTLNPRGVGRNRDFEYTSKDMENR